MKTLPQIALDFAAAPPPPDNKPGEQTPAPPSAASPVNEETAGVGVRIKYTRKEMESGDTESAGTESEAVGKETKAVPNDTASGIGKTVPDSKQTEGGENEAIKAVEVNETAENATESVVAPEEVRNPETGIGEESPGQPVIEATFLEISSSSIRAQQKPPKQSKSTRGRKSLKQATAEADLIEVPGDDELFSKQYYTMGEVATMFRVNQSLLRFWESEFDILKPRKNKKGDRHFRPIDIKNLHLIYNLLRQRKYTIEGAKEFLKNSKKADARFESIRRLQEIRAFLLELKARV